MTVPPPPRQDLTQGNPDDQTALVFDRPRLEIRRDEAG